MYYSVIRDRVALSLQEEHSFTEHAIISSISRINYVWYHYMETTHLSLVFWHTIETLVQNISALIISVIKCAGHDYIEEISHSMNDYTV